MKIITGIFFFLLVSGCGGPPLSVQEKFISQNIQPVSADTTNILFIFPNFCGACTIESMKIIDPIVAEREVKVVATDSSFIQQIKDLIVIDYETLSKNGIMHATNQLYQVINGHIFKKIPINDENKVELYQTLNIKEHSH